jgi:hypothetical protein
MSFDAYPNHLGGSIMVAVNGTDNPVSSQSGTAAQYQLFASAGGVTDGARNASDATQTDEGESSTQPHGNPDQSK